MSRIQALIDDVRTLRKAQEAYMADRGNEELGKKVAEAARMVDESMGRVLYEFERQIGVLSAIEGERDY